MMKRIVLSVCAAVFAAVSAQGASTLDYVQDGLVAHWDGCENVGRWQHASTTAVWRDLIGGVLITNNTAGTDLVVGETSITVPGKSVLKGEMPFLGDVSHYPNYTVEVVARSVAREKTERSLPLYVFSSSRGFILFYGTDLDSSQGLYIRYKYNSKNDCYENTSKFMKSGFDEFHTYSLATTYESDFSAFAVDGQVHSDMTRTLDTASAAALGSAFSLGRLDKIASFEYQSIRIYSRKLTDKEIAQNRAVDVSRFVDGDRPSLLQVQGEPLPYGEVVPAYGDYALNVGDRRTCSVVSSTGIGRTNVTCIGYAVYTNDVRTAGAEYMSGAGSSFEYVHPANAYATVVWKWNAEEDASLPLVTNVTVDGSLGDTLKVRGTLAELGDESCALKVLVREAAEESSQEWASADWTRTATGDFELELYENDPTSPRAIKFGRTYVVYVEATSGGKSSRSKAASVTMPASYATTYSYVQKDLVTHFDGIENAGRGQHEPKLSVWKDLVGSGGIDLATANPVIGSNSIFIQNGSPWLEGFSSALARNQPVTVEELARADVLDETKLNNYPEYLFNGCPILMGYFARDNVGFSVRIPTPTQDKGLSFYYSNFTDYYAFHTYSASYWDSAGEKCSLGIDGTNRSLRLSPTQQTQISGSGVFRIGRPSGATPSYMQATFRSIRIYSRVLAAEEIAHNRWIDRIRFDGEQPEDVLPDGVRMVRGGEVQYRVRVVSPVVGVGTDGESFATGTNDFWVAFGETITVHAQTSPGQRVVWTGAPADTVCSDTGDQVSFTVTRPLALAVDATFTPTHVWTGAASTDFASAANWTNATADAAVAAPNVGDDVYIPAGCVRQPTAATPFSVRSFRIGRLAGESGTATFTANTALTNVVSGDVVVYAGGVLTHYGPEASPTKKLILTVGGNMTVHADGAVHADDRGYSSGRMYPGVNNNGSGNHDHDAIKTPCLHGSGGNSGGGGGGVVRLMVAGTLQIDGRVSADAPDTTWVSGAGGAVWLSAARFTGRGTVSAAGGGTTGSQVNANGSGGRVALYATESDGMFAGRVRAPCGFLGSATKPTTSSDGVGRTGTVYLQAGDGPGDFILDNEIYTVGGDTTIKTDSTDGTDIAFHDVIVTNRARLKLSSGLTLRVTGDWLTTGGRLTADASTHVYFEGADTANVCGDNTFGSVTCVAPGKAFRFGTGASDNFAIPEGCSLVWRGAANNLISLWPSAPDGIWKLCVAKNATYDFSYLSVSNSNASAGQGLTAPHSENMGGNTYWSFANPAEEGDPITWTGEVDTDWFNSANWVDRYGDARGVAPGDRVSIPSAPTNQPVAQAGDIAVCDLTVEAGASLELDRANLTVTNALSVVGSLTADGTERISCLGSVVFAGASTYSGARATFALTGNVAQDVMFSGKSFGIFEITKNGGEVRFADGLTADMFSLLAQGPFAVEYRSGATYAFGEFMASGYVGGEPAVSFRASVTESPWMVSASRMSYVAGVSVSDSTAVGTAIRADVGCSLTSCVNWTRGEGACRTWKGGDGNFNTASAWSPEGVPGPLDMVQVYTRSGEAPKITVSDARTVAELVVSGAGSPTLVVTGPFHVTGNAEIVGKTTVQMNSRNAWTVDGDLTFRTGSTLTQTTPASNADVAKYSISVDVGGDFTMEPGTVVNAEAMGPFYQSSVEGTPASWGAGSHGGRADYASYDSILAPVMYGGCGGGAKGGGIIRLACGGTMRLDGAVNADGGKNDSDKTARYSGAGGSVWLTCGLLTGSGTVSARGGGWDLGAKSYAGAGGRISVWQEQDEDAFTGIFAVRGGEGTTSGSGIGGGAGSVYVSRGGDSKVGTVTFANYNKVVQSSNFPMKDDGEAKKVYRGVTVVVTNAAWLALTGNVTIRELELASNAKVDLGTNTLTIISQAHKGFKGWPKGASIVSNQVDGVWGKVVWKKPGFALIVR